MSGQSDGRRQMSVTQRVPAPFGVRELKAFLDVLPDVPSLEISIKTYTTGKRDPVDAGYRFTATWATDR